MKGIALLLFTTAFVSSLCFAQQPQVPVNPTVTQTATTNVITGRIEDVGFGDSTKGIKPGILLVEADGRKKSFVVKSTTTIYDVDLKIIKLENIKKDVKAKVTYIINKNGDYDIVSINLLK
ncbi:MAG: hypothetical protein NTW64_01170 [Candidatus Omnitrophica bacterium]|nr:hypothetical protein [Candidatus Omnitrophota bacterium]